LLPLQFFLLILDLRLSINPISACHGNTTSQAFN
jgi:hypothetical protein